MRAPLFLFAAFMLLGQTSPAPPDGDQDGIPDEWENSGVQLRYPDGSTHLLDLKALGALPAHKDIIVWIDWMGDETIPGTPPTTHNHQPMDAALAEVKAAFANAVQFTSNPDHTTGVHVITIVSPTPVSHKDMLGSGDPTDGTLWNDFDAIKSSRFPALLNGIAHYCLFAHDISKDGASGISRDVGAYDFIVSLGQFQDDKGNEDQQAGTFMHELGHNLGLQHGGADDWNNKPNYLSVMNYLFQQDGLTVPEGVTRFNYSTTVFPNLNEPNLDETQPISTDATWKDWGSGYFCPSDRLHSKPITSINQRVDWNCDGTNTQHVQSDINADFDDTTDLTSALDWPLIQFVYPNTGQGTPVSGVRRRIAEMTVADADRITVPPASNLSSLVHGQYVRLSWRAVANLRVRGYQVTRIQPGVAPVSFVTTGISFVDHLPSQIPSVRYAVTTLYISHAARRLINITGEQRNGFNILQIGKMRQAVAARLADKNTVALLIDNLRQNFRTATQGMGPRALPWPGLLNRLAAEIQDLRLLLTSEAATIEVKLG